MLERARDAYERRQWFDAVEGFEVARAAGGATADDLLALADALWWLGEADRSISAAEEAYRRFLHGEGPTSAAMAAMTVAMNLLLRGDVSLGAGWMGRAVRLVEDRPDAVEHHYLRYLTQVEGRIGDAATLPDHEFSAVIATARDLQDAGRRLGDDNLVAAASAAEGRMLLKRGAAGDAVRLLDEAMVSALTGDLLPDWAGNVYCHLMAACHEAGDIARAREWTRATERWLDTLPAAVLFRGVCRVHRSQVLQTMGEWDRAEAEARRVCAELASIAPATAAEGHYQLGEIARLRGDLAGAEAEYQRAHAAGRDPQPGLSLLRLAQGRAGIALGTLRAALVACAGDPLASFPLRVAQVEVALATGALREALAACQVVEELAARFGTSGFACAALASRGRYELHAGRAEAALPVLREACRRWREVGADYHAATMCLLLADAYRSLGAEDAARLEDAAANEALDRLGVRTRARSGLVPARRPPDGLTAREAEVLALVATGKSNRDVAAALVLSEKTIARHLSNIFAKIGVGSRTAAAAYAFRHGIASPPTPDTPRRG